MFMQRDLHLCKVTYIYAKRPVFMQRKTECNKTYVYEQRRTHHAHRSRRSWYAKRPTQMERDLYMKEKRMQRDLCICKETHSSRTPLTEELVCKETYTYGKRHTYVCHFPYIIIYKGNCMQRDPYV